MNNVCEIDVDEGEMMRMIVSKHCFVKVVYLIYRYNEHWGDKVGFFGQFETIDDPTVPTALITAASDWLKSKGMNRMRGPQNLPVNEATPGILTKGFNSRPVMYYHYNKPYYEKLLRDIGFEPVKQVYSWEVRVQNPMEEKLARVAQKVIDRFELTIEDWGDRPLYHS